MPSLGDEFRVAREARGLSLSDVAEQLHIRSTYLQAIEEEDWPAIGAPVYTRGFLRTYARFLGLDPEHAIEAFTHSTPSAPPAKQWSGSSTPIGVPRRSGPSVFAWLAALVALALIGYVGYGYYQLKTTPPPAPSAAPAASPAAAGSAAPTAVATAAPTPEPRSTGKTLDVHLTQLSWMRVSVDGKVVLEGEFPPGTSRSFAGKHVRLLVGNAAGVEVSAPGEPTRILGSAGQVVERDYVLPAKKAH